jgi:hypothetical protein
MILFNDLYNELKTFSYKGEVHCYFVAKIQKSAKVKINYAISFYKEKSTSYFLTFPVLTSGSQ